MEVKEILKKIIDDANLDEEIMMWGVRSDMYGAIQKKWSNQSPSRIMSCLFEIYYDQKVRKSCLEIIQKIDYTPKYHRPRFIQIPKYLYEGLKDIAKNAGMTRQALYKKVLYIIANDLFEFRLPKVRFIQFHKV